MRSLTTSPAISYLPIGRKTFDTASAWQVFEGSLDYLKSLEAEISAPEGIITSLEELKAELGRMSEAPDLVVFQLTTFADAEFVRKTSETLRAPLVVWSVLEPEASGRLRLNSLTGGNSACHYLRSIGHPYAFVYGNPEDPDLRGRLERQVRVRRVVKDLSRLTVAVVGEHPPGFFFADTDDRDLELTIGARVRRLDVRAVFEEAEAVSEEEWRPIVEEASESIVGLSLRDETVRKFAKLTAYLRRYAEDHSIGAMAIRNWPEFFDEFGAAACSAMSLLTDTGLPSANESDIHGAITMYIQQQLVGSSAYLGDLAYMDVAQNSFTFWHDGAGAPSLAGVKSKARVGRHPNRNIGLTLEVGLKAGQVTVARLGRSRGRFRLLIFRGEALDVPQRFAGTSVVVRLEGSAQEMLYSMLDEGWEPHYSLVYGDCVADLEELGSQLGIEVVSYA